MAEKRKHLRTYKEAVRVAARFKRSQDIGFLVQEVSEWSYYFGQYTRYNRELFVRFLRQQLGSNGSESDNCAAGIGIEMHVHPGGVKCPGCNHETSATYALANSRPDEEGLCAQCFMDVIVGEGMEVRL